MRNPGWRHLPRIENLGDAVLLLVALVSIASLALVGVVTLTVNDTAAGVNASERSDQVTGCRSEYRARIDRAQLERDDAESRRLDAFADVVVAGALDRPEELAAAGRALEGTDDDITDARRRLNIATLEYADAVTRSREDPEAFVARCQADPP